MRTLPFFFTLLVVLSVTIARPLYAGEFSAAVPYAAAAEGTSIVSGDLNHDNHLDVVVSNSEHGVSVLLGNGDGTFQAVVKYPTPPPGTVLSDPAQRMP